MHVFPWKAHPIDKFKGAHFLKAKWAWQTCCSHLTTCSACHHPYSEHSSGDWAEWSPTDTTTERRQKLRTEVEEPVQVQQAPVSATLMGAPWSVLQPMSPEEPCTRSQRKRALLAAPPWTSWVIAVKLPSASASSL